MLEIKYFKDLEGYNYNITNGKITIKFGIVLRIVKHKVKRVINAVIYTGNLVDTQYGLDTQQAIVYLNGEQIQAVGPYILLTSNGIIQTIYMEIDEEENHTLSEFVKQIQHDYNIIKQADEG